MESLRFGRKLLCILFLLVHFSEVPIRLAIEHIKMYVHLIARGKITNKIEISKEKWRKIWWETKNIVYLQCQS